MHACRWDPFHSDAHQPAPLRRRNLLVCRIRLQLRPGRYGNLEGTQRVAMDYLARAEGVMEP